MSQTIEFRKPGYVTLDGTNWRIVERIHNAGRIYLNLIRRGKVRTIRVK